MKFVIYKVEGIYYLTTESNYNAPMQNTREIQCLRDFNSPKEIMDYYHKFCGVQPKGFKLTETTAKEFLMELGWNEYGADAILKEIDLATLTVEDLMNLSEDYKDR